VEQDAIHETADGRKLLVIHGDQFDASLNMRVGSPFSATGLFRALRLNTTYNLARRKMGLPLLVASAYLKHKVKTRSSISTTTSTPSPAKRGGAVSMAWSVAISIMQRSGPSTA